MDVSRFLSDLRLGQYTAVLKQEGFDELETLFQITELDL